MTEWTSVKVDEETRLILEELKKQGMCSSLADCVRRLAQSARTPKFIANKVHQLLEEAKAWLSLAHAEDMVRLLETVRFFIIRYLIHGQKMCRVLQEVIDDVCSR